MSHSYQSWVATAADTLSLHYQRCFLRPIATYSNSVLHEHYMKRSSVPWESLPQVRLWLAGVSSRKPGSDPTSLQGNGRGFVVDKVGPGLLLRIIRVSTVSTIPPIFRTNISFAYITRYASYNLDKSDRRWTHEYYLFILSVLTLPERL